MVAILALLVFTLTGCTVQPTDPKTGEPIGDPVMATNPADIADAVEQGSQAAQAVAPTFGPWGVAVAALLGAATPIVVRKLRKKKETPAS
jgi:hypothetical protein